MDLKPHYPVTRTFRLHGSIGKIAALIKSFPTVPNMKSFGKNYFGVFGHVNNAQYDVIMADLGVALDVFKYPPPILLMCKNSYFRQLSLTQVSKVS